MNMKRIVNVSRFLKWCAVLLCFALPMAEAGFWITNGYPFLEPWIKYHDVLFGVGEQLTAWADLNEVQKLLGFIIGMLPLSFSMAALAYLAQLFGAFERLELFDKRNVQILKRAGWALVWGQIIYPVHFAFFSLAMTYRNPVGKRNISLAFGNTQVEILVIGISILLLSWVFEEAVKLHEEQISTV
jgi:hypothetical protein